MEPKALYSQGLRLGEMLKSNSINYHQDEQKLKLMKNGSLIIFMIVNKTD